jgi:predicted AAA+ superfamily ATPase
MLPRLLDARLSYRLRHSPAVVLLGPRQVGKTTLALEVAERQPSVYLDLEDDADRAKLSNPALYFADHDKDLAGVYSDEIGQEGNYSFCQSLTAKELYYLRANSVR